MKKSIRILPALALILAAGSIAQAQEMAGPPKVLVVGREVEKLGKWKAHETNEHAWAAANQKANLAPYIAVSAITGPPRVLFLQGFDTMAAWEADTKAIEKNDAFQAQLTGLLAKDSELLTDNTVSVLVYSPEDSYEAPNATPVPRMRYFMIQIIALKPGHFDQFHEARKIIKAAHEKAGLTDSYYVYHRVAGGNVNYYAIFIPLKSLGDLDSSAVMHNAKPYQDALGDEGRKKLGELGREGLESNETEYFAFSPKMSHAPADFIKADPDFWAPKTAAPAKAKAAAKETPKP